MKSQKSKHNPQAELLITEYINSKPEFARLICDKIREVIITSFPKIIEDWKWGPNYYSHGMVCGFGAFQKHVTLFFFRGAELIDPDKVLHQNLGTQKNRHIKFTNVKEVNAKRIKSLVKQSIVLNKTVPVVRVKSDKVVILPDDFKKELIQAKSLTVFEMMAFYRRKELVHWINDAKREETRMKRIDKALDHVSNNRSPYEYRK
ncbi:hypothetical protein BH11BAC2_BH11BAC2_17830 [soil metagenome]